ncbi:MAG TPA: hypothetical protein VMN36_18105 [Verrucomicrobiales bacterium]|nr:hypothetical protein [Verrucomicrobiales bacterium]
MDNGAVQVAGVLQEQHPERALLFRQWKELDFPLLSDPLNLLDVKAVPITLLVDANGVIRFRNPSEEDWERFLALEPAQAPEPPELPGQAWAEADFAAQEGRFEEALSGYARALVDDPSEGRLHFRSGVVYRARHDSGKGRPDDFAQAAQFWQRALDLEPGQYIWRRRIQQYGPRLDKPYPFYDWVKDARREIVERGGEPLPLRVEPSGAELASPARPGEASGPNHNPDPEGSIERVEEESLAVEAVAVFSTARDAGTGAIRVHLRFRPAGDSGLHWNNEAEPLTVWIDTPAGAEAVPVRLEYPNPEDRAVSAEERTIEFELTWPGGEAGPESVGGFALFNVCRDDDAQCLFRRLDFRVDLTRQQRR